MRRKRFERRANSLFLSSLSHTEIAAGQRALTDLRLERAAAPVPSRSGKLLMHPPTPICSCPGSACACWLGCARIWPAKIAR